MKSVHRDKVRSVTKDCQTGTCNSSGGKKNFQLILMIMLFIISWSALLLYIQPKEIVMMLGVHNTYIFIFMLALLGGVSTFTSTTFYTTLITISLGGIDPIVVALLASLGLTLGDMLFYYLGIKCKSCIRGKYESYVSQLTERMKQLDSRITMLFIFFYSLTPLPSDIIAISLAILEFPFKKMIFPLLLGNFTLIFLLIEITRYGYDLIWF